MKKNLLLLLLTFSFLTACDWWQPHIEPNGREVFIGFMSPSPIGKEEINTHGLGGLKSVFDRQPLLDDGTKISIVEIDTAISHEHTVKELENMAMIDNLLAVVSFNNSETILLLNPIADRLKLPIIAAAATHPDVAKNTQYMNQFLFDDTFQGKISALYVRDELLMDRVATISNPERVYSSYLEKTFSRNFSLVNGEVVSELKISAEQQPDLVMIKNLIAKKPQLIYATVNSSQLIVLLQHLNEFNPSPVIMVPDSIMSDLLQLYPDKADLYEGLVATDVFSPDLPIKSRITEVFGRGHALDLDLLNSHTAIGIESGLLLHRALNYCQQEQLDKLCVQSAIRQTNALQGLVGRISINANGKVSRPLIISEITGGEAKFLVRIY